MASVVEEVKFYGNYADGYAQFELYLVYFIAGLGILLRNVVYQKHQHLYSSRSKIFLREFVFTILPMVLAQTFFADGILSLAVVMMALIALYFFANNFSRLWSAQKWSLTPVESSELIRNSVSSFRTMTFVSTSIAILAVDFEVFPRRFAKTERFGHSLMDTGTAAFVVVNALSDYRNLVVSGGGRRNPYLSLFSLRVPSFFVLLLMGVGRSVFVLLYGYQQNVTEYGVHWNFFVTLFCLRCFVELFSYPYSMYVGLFVGVCYEIALEKFGLADFILREDNDENFPPGRRSGFLDENREGISSMFGYIFLYSLALLYAKISMTALQRNSKASLTKIFTHGLSFVGIFVGLQKVVEYLDGLPTSRRLANMSYVFAMIALFSFSVSGLQLLGYFVGGPPISSKFAKYSMVQAVSRNGLLYFLVSNLVTGLVNIFVLRVYNLEHNGVNETLFIVLYAFLTTLFITIINGRRKEE